MTKKKKQVVSTDMLKVRKLLNDIPKDRKPIAEGLYNELVFMQNTMSTLKIQVDEEGAVSMFKQGQQEFLREHPALSAYNKTIQRYTQVYKQLIELLPKLDDKKQGDELMDFIAK